MNLETEKNVEIMEEMIKEIFNRNETLKFVNLTKKYLIIEIRII